MTETDLSRHHHNEACIFACRLSLRLDPLYWRSFVIVGKSRTKRLSSELVGQIRSGVEAFAFAVPSSRRLEVVHSQSSLVCQ